MSQDRRHFPRRSLQYSAWIVFSAETKPVLCEVTDVSSHGAHLVVEQAQLIPDVFLLSFSAHGVPARPCRVVWRKDSDIGVEYAMEQANAEPHRSKISEAA